MNAVACLPVGSVVAQLEGAPSTAANNAVSLATHLRNALRKLDDRESALDFFVSIAFPGISEDQIPDLKRRLQTYCGTPWNQREPNAAHISLEQFLKNLEKYGDANAETRAYWAQELLKDAGMSMVDWTEEHTHMNQQLHEMPGEPLTGGAALDAKLAAAVDSGLFTHGQARLLLHHGVWGWKTTTLCTVLLLAAIFMFAVAEGRISINLVPPAAQPTVAVSTDSEEVAVRTVDFDHIVQKILSVNPDFKILVDEVRDDYNPETGYGGFPRETAIDPEGGQIGGNWYNLKRQVETRTGLGYETFFVRSSYIAFLRYTPEDIEQRLVEGSIGFGSAKVDTLKISGVNGFPVDSLVLTSNRQTTQTDMGSWESKKDIDKGFSEAEVATGNVISRDFLPIAAYKTIDGGNLALAGNYAENMVNGLFAGVALFKPAWEKQDVVVTVDMVYALPVDANKYQGGKDGVIPLQGKRYSSVITVGDFDLQLGIKQELSVRVTLRKPAGSNEFTEENVSLLNEPTKNTLPRNK